MMRERHTVVPALICCMLTLCTLMTGCGFQAPRLFGVSLFGEKKLEHFEQTVILENNTSDDLQVPADFVVKVAGNTVYTFEDKEIPVGEMMKQFLEENLKKIERFSVNQESGNQYVIGVDILNYEPVVDPSKREKFLYIFPEILCEVNVYRTEIIDSGEKMIGERVINIPYAARYHGASSEYKSDRTALPLVALLYSSFTASSSWRTVVEDCAEDISKSLDKAFPKKNTQRVK